MTNLTTNASSLSNVSDAMCTTTISGDYCCSNTVACKEYVYAYGITPYRTYCPDMYRKHKVPGSFVYLDECKDLKEVYIKEVRYQNPATIVFWSDGTKTVSKTHAGDEYSPEAGLVLCILKKTQGKTLRGLFEAWIPEQAFAQPNKAVIQTLKNVRKLFKKK